MRVLSLNVGMPREVLWGGRQVRTGIFKQPVAGRVAVRTLGIDGDGQANLRVHGGVSKAVYIYPYEHYAYWQDRLDLDEIEFGAFGENLTTEGLEERTIRVGDRLKIGSTELIVTEPRLPCRNLAMRFGQSDLVGRFLESGRTGFYLSVLTEGEIGSGDSIRRRPAHDGALTIASIVESHRP